MTSRILFLLAALGWLSAAGQKAITVEDFTTKPTFQQQTVTGIHWMKNGKFYTSLKDNQVVQYDITTGKPVAVLVDGKGLALTIDDYAMSGDERSILLSTDREPIYRRSYKANYFVYHLATKAIQQLSAGGKESYATFSPDGARVAFVRNNNLFYTTLAGMQETQVTTDGLFNSIINGSCDWVYEEEFGFAKAFYWSPDSRYLAYYRFDESGVKMYTLQEWNHGQLYPSEYSYKYPKAGEANSNVQIWTVELASGNKTQADLGAETDVYIPRVMWTATPGLLSVRRMNRLQNKIDVIHVQVKDGSATVALSEQSDTFIDLEYCDDLTYLADGAHFVYSSERSGFKQLYLYTMDGTLEGPITSGKGWEVTSMYGIDEKTHTVYYQSTEGGYLDRQLYRIGLDGKGKKRLSNTPGTHDMNISPDFQFYLDYASAADQPLSVSLYRTKDNAPVKVLEENKALQDSIKAYRLVKKDFFNYPAADGTALDGYLLRPHDFDSTKRYPVVIYQYSGPRAPNVLDAYGGSHYYYHQMLVQQGFIVAVMDTRGTGYRGEQFTKQTYKELGKLELEDLVSGAAFLRALPFVDAHRIGIWGWSYGGYMTCLAMTKAAGTFDLGIAVSPVTNWRFYDTIYTERYMQTPQLNPSGYDDNSPTTYADRLQGKFLMTHGTADDNVHFQNSVALADALIAAQKQFRTFYYPDKNHSLAPGVSSREHLYKMMDAYLLENL